MPRQEYRYDRESPPWRSVVYIIISIIVLGVIYWAATSYWHDSLPQPAMKVCPEGMAFSHEDRICIPGAEPRLEKKARNE